MSSLAEALLTQEGFLIPLILYEKYPIFYKGMLVSRPIEMFNKNDRLLMVTDNNDTLAADNLQDAQQQ